MTESLTRAQVLELVDAQLATRVARLRTRARLIGKICGTALTLLVAYSAWVGCDKLEDVADSVARREAERAIADELEGELSPIAAARKTAHEALEAMSNSEQDATSILKRAESVDAKLEPVVRDAFAEIERQVDSVQGAVARWQGWFEARAAESLGGVDEQAREQISKKQGEILGELDTVHTTAMAALRERIDALQRALASVPSDGATRGDAAALSLFSERLDQLLVRVALLEEAPDDVAAALEERRFGAIPAGTIVAYFGETAPAGWLLCDGSELDAAVRPECSELVALLRGRAGDASGRVRLPDLRGRFLVGVGEAAGLSRRSLGEIGGVETVQLTLAEMPLHNHPAKVQMEAAGAHTHTVTGRSADDDGGSSSDDHFAMGDDNKKRSFPKLAVSTDGAHVHPVSASTDSVGEGKPFSTAPPFTAVNYLIKW